MVAALLAIGTGTAVPAAALGAAALAAAAYAVPARVERLPARGGPSAPRLVSSPWPRSWPSWAARPRC